MCRRWVYKVPAGHLATLYALAILMTVPTAALREGETFASLLNERLREENSAVRPPNAAGTELRLRGLWSRLGIGKIPLNSGSALPVARMMFGTVRSGNCPLPLRSGVELYCTRCPAGLPAGVSLSCNGT